MEKVGAAGDAAESVTPLRPSEAMRLGRLSLDQSKSGQLFERPSEGEPTAGCALGAMAVGYGEEASKLYGKAFYWPDEIPNLPMTMLCRCEGFSSRTTAMSFVIHTYDSHTMGQQPPYISEAQIIEHLSAYGL